MQISLQLNDENCIIDASPEEHLFDVLRHRGLTSVKCACNHGICGTCAVLVNDKPVPSCLLPVAAVQGKKVMTLERFQETEDFLDIKNGFEQAKVQLCGFCNASKYFATWDLIHETPRPQKEDILKYISTLGCHCTETNTLLNGILYAATMRRVRLSKAEIRKDSGRASR